MKSQGFQQSGFEESVWIRKADALLPHDVFMSAHIDNTLILCSDRDTLRKFKAMLLARFDSTDEGEVETLLGCEIVRDCEAKTIQIRQPAYIQKVLAIHGMDGPGTYTFGTGRATYESRLPVSGRCCHPVGASRYAGACFVSCADDETGSQLRFR